ncbi:MAG: trigger factor [Proteobacteria bacterium]|nr:trigger factor [Pseudomonadota bacterium]
MQVSLSDTGGLSRRLEVAVPANEVSREVQERLKRLSRTARLKGFRPGKAPLAVVTKQFGEQVRAEVMGDLMRSSFAQAVTQEGLKPAAGPRIEPLAMGPDADLKYAAHFEVLPEIRLNPPETIEIERPTAVVTDADVDAMVQNMRQQRPQFTPVDRPARDTDRITLDYQTRMGGRKIDGGEYKDVRIVLGAHQTMPELEAGLQGVRAGEQRTIAVTFAPNHPDKKLAGQAAEVDLQIKAVEEQSLPEVDEAFCKAYGVEEGGLPEMRAEVRRSMERELADVIRRRVRGQLLDGLFRANPIEVPRAMVDEQVQQLQLDTARRFGIQDVNQLPPRQTFEEPARRRAALGLLVSQIVQSQGLTVDRERLRARLTEIVESHPNPEDAQRAYLQNPEAMRQVEAATLEDQVIDWLSERARATDKPTNFSELTGFGRTGAAQGEAGHLDPAAGEPHDHAGHQHEQAGGT